MIEKLLPFSSQEKLERYEPPANSLLPRLCWETDTNKDEIDIYEIIDCLAGDFSVNYYLRDYYLNENDLSFHGLDLILNYNAAIAAYVNFYFFYRKKNSQEVKTQISDIKKQPQGKDNYYYSILLDLINQNDVLDGLTEKMITHKETNRLEFDNALSTMRNCTSTCSFYKVRPSWNEKEWERVKKAFSRMNISYSAFYNSLRNVSSIFTLFDRNKTENIALCYLFELLFHKQAFLLFKRMPKKKLIKPS